MNKLIKIVLILFWVFVLKAQDTTISDLKAKIILLQGANNNLKNEVKKLDSKLTEFNLRIDSLRSQTKQNNNSITQTANQLGIQIKETGDKNEGKIIEVSNSLSKNSLYSIIGVLSAILLSGLIYWLLSKRQQSDKMELNGKLENKTSTIKSDVFSELEKTKNELTQESAKLDVQLLDVIEKQLKVADKLNETETTVDHTFHKNSANELQRIANYTNTLAPESQEAIALTGSLMNLRNYFEKGHYEIIDFTGSDFDPNIPMVVVNSIFDDTLNFGREIISRTKKPQIKYKGNVIQKPEVIIRYNN
jgi:hypothetical protein